MELLIQNDEAELLESILSNYLSDLRVEICRTDDYTLRQTLKRQGEKVKALIARLPEPAALVV